MIWALHGAFGDARDWDGLASELDSEVRPIDLWSPEHDLSLAEWGRVFNRTVSDADSEPILLGYSMGARLGLHALIQEESPWKAAILVSPRPGIEPEKRRARRKSDDTWLQRFDELASMLTRFREASSANKVEAIVTISPADAVPHGRIVKVMDPCSLAGIEAVNFALGRTAMSNA